MSFLAAPVAAQSFEAPSGLIAEVAEVVIEDAADLARFRFVAPTLGQGAFEDAAADATWMCEALAVPSLTAQAQAPGQIIIALADRDVPFGTSDPDATQFFFAFATDGETCTEELY